MTKLDLVRKTSAEYKTLQAIISGVSEILEAPPTGIDWHRKLARDFEHLRAHLIKLFALEESEGFLHAVESVRPDQAARAQRFRSEHAALMHRCSELMNSVSQIAPTAADKGTELRGLIRQLVDDLRKHESAEGELLQTVFNQDINSTD